MTALHVTNSKPIIYQHTKYASVLIPLFILLISSPSCQDSSSQKNPGIYFQQRKAQETHIQFANTIKEDTTLNIIQYAYMYNGGGVGIGDFDNDGWEDIYFTGNQVTNELYMNKGGLAFENVTADAGLTTDRWSNGVAIADVNSDGWLDIYVSCVEVGDGRSGKNLLFINRTASAGKVYFEEMAGEYELDDPGFCVQSTFFDYDLDGDLDIFLVRNHLQNFPQNTLRPMQNDGSGASTDRLLRNQLNENKRGIQFEDVSKAAGILKEGYGLGVTVSDLNLDGWPDIYVANDFISHDFIYLNRQDGTFQEVSKSALQHQSRHSMGVDIADLDNDGWPDIFVADMLPLDPQREKQMINGFTYDYFSQMAELGYGKQYIHNTLQMNNGLNPKNDLSFSECAGIAGLDRSDWSWSVLMADFDNDSDKDLFITNGIFHDITNSDFVNYGMPSTMASHETKHVFQRLEALPIVKLPNLLFRNDGPFTFTNKSQQWGLDIPTISQGAAYADLDNDGDLDLVTNNLNETASIFENRSPSSNYIQIMLEGTPGNLEGLGSKIQASSPGHIQHAEHYRQKGFQSSTGGVIHFGLGTDSLVDRLTIKWPDGAKDQWTDLKANKRYTLVYGQGDTTKTINEIEPMSATPFEFRENLIDYTHTAFPNHDFYYERLLPQSYSMGGPALAVGDIDRNGLDDVIIGQDKAQASVFLQKEAGAFTLAETFKTLNSTKANEMGILIYDFDNDDDNDLYIAMGGNRFPRGDKAYQDRFYENKAGDLVLNDQVLPSFIASSSSVTAADYDRDGDLDLFVSARLTPRQFPSGPKSYLLENVAGQYHDVSHLLPDNGKLGMLSQALWTDFDGDLRVDLIVVGEWMPPRFIKNTPGGFQDHKALEGPGPYSGYWNGITGADFDNDGDIDYIAGNMGLNNRFKASREKPIQLFAIDLDQNGSIEPIFTYYHEDQILPLHSRDALVEQVPLLKKQFTTYSSYARATLDSILTPGQQAASLVLRADYLSHAYLKNIGDGHFEVVELPVQTQVAPIFGLLPLDYDQDGDLDIIYCGNNFAPSILIGQFDASIGGILRNDGKSGFHHLGSRETGFFAAGDTRGLALLTGPGSEVQVVVASNNAPVLAYRLDMPGRRIKLGPQDFFAEVELMSGETSKHEFYYGEGYLVQQSRTFIVPVKATSVKIYSYEGNSRTIIL